MSSVRSFRVLALCFALSGAASLIHQVVWMRELSLLFGATTGAAATTLGVLFLGLAIGGAWAGRGAGTLKFPLRRFALLELAIALLAPLVLWLRPLHEQIAEVMPGAMGRLSVAALALLPAAIAMGATLPVLAEALLRGRTAWGRGATMLYATNTLGAALGAWIAGFVLPEAIGYRATLGVASGLGVAVALAAFWIARRAPSPDGSEDPVAAEPVDAEACSGPRGLFAWVAFGSGALALGLEVVWTRTFQLVLQNSVYTYTLVVVAYLLALGLGALLAHLLTHAAWRPRRVLATLLVLAGVLVCFGPRFFGLWRDIPGVLASGLTFWPYVITAFLSVAGLLLIPTIVLGAVFPYLMKLSEGRGRPLGDSDLLPGARRGHTAGERLGRLLWWNTLGAAAGALAAGFWLVPRYGTSLSAIVLGGIYVLLGLATQPRPGRSAIVLVPLLILLGLEGAHQAQADRERARPRRYDTVQRRFVPDGTVVASYASAMATVTVTQRVPGGSKRLRLDGAYTLGSSAAPEWERLQAHLPLLIHPHPKRAFFLGLGTGITAGGATVHALDQITAVELVPEVVDAARDHFAELTQGLFDDPRVRILADDARHVLRREDARYDVIVGDLFLPWKRGVSSLFSREQLEAGKARLAEGGIYAQWLPLYQLSRDEVEVITRTFVSVFPRVTAWHGDFFGKRPILCVIGHSSRTPIDLRAVGERFDALAARGELGFEREGAASLPWLMHIGALEQGAPVLGSGRLETEDHPVLAFSAPRHQRARSAGREVPLAGTTLLTWLREVRKADPSQLAIVPGRSPSEVALLRAGAALYTYAALREGDGKRAALLEFTDAVPAEARPNVRTWAK